MLKLVLGLTASLMSLNTFAQNTVSCENNKFHAEAELKVGGKLKVKLKDSGMQKDFTIQLISQGELIVWANGNPEPSDAPFKEADTIEVNASLTQFEGSNQAILNYGGRISPVICGAQSSKTPNLTDSVSIQVPKEIFTSLGQLEKENLKAIYCDGDLNRDFDGGWVMSEWSVVDPREIKFAIYDYTVDRVFLFDLSKWDGSEHDFTSILPPGQISQIDGFVSDVRTQMVPNLLDMRLEYKEFASGKKFYNYDSLDNEEVEFQIDCSK